MKHSHRSAAPLWTRDFTIITLGSVVSMLGNSMAGFALSLLVLDYTGSSLLYAIYLVVYTLPQIIMPIFSGAILDRFSRKKAIYTLDYLSGALYLLLAALLWRGWFSFPVFALACFVIGSVNSIYLVAYESFYPMLISEGNYSRAYAIAGVLETLSALMIPAANFAYDAVGVGPLMLFISAIFLLAATMETQIRAKEDYIESQKQTAVFRAGKQMLVDIKEGFCYLAGERGLLIIAIYFIFMSLSGGASLVITLPYFKSAYENGAMLYSIIAGLSTVGRGVGGALHYFFKIPARRKYAIALSIYVAMSLLEAVYLYTALPVMAVMSFLLGMCGVTTYTIRISATQSYVPNEKKGRFNGAFNMLNTVGTLSAQLLAGALATVVDQRLVLVGFVLLNGLAALVIIGGGKKHVEAIYNTDQ